MKSAPWKAVAAVFAAGCVALVPVKVTAQELNDLGSLGGANSAGVAINSRGQVTGSAEVAGGDDHAFLYSEGVMVDLGTLGGTWSYATAINDAGQVVGYSALPGDSTQHAFLYSDGVMIDLGTLGGTWSEATDINEAGQVTGTAFPASGSAHPFRWTNGTMEDLGTLAGGIENEAAAINDSGEVAGTSGGRAFLFTGGAMVDLGPGTAVGLNNAGQVAFNSGFQGYLYSGGATTSLGTIDGHPLSAADINESGQVAGDISGAPGHHFLYSDGSAIDIGQVYGGSTNVRALNDFGQILILIDDGADYRIALYSDGQFAEDVVEANDVTVWAVSLNNAGQITGQRQRFFPPFSYGPNVAFVTLCPPVPALGCAGTRKSSIRVKVELDPADDSLKWTWKGADPVAQADLGTPATSTSYHACLYEAPNSRRRMAARFGLAPSAAWSDRSPRGWTYSDKLAGVSGIKKLVIKAGEAGKSSVKLIADGEAIPMPSPFLSELLTGEVAMSLHNDATGACMSATFATPSTSEIDRYSAKTP